MMTPLETTFVLVAILGCSLNPVVTNENSTCSMKMFGNDFSAYMACVTEFAHQCNWFPSPIAGLFSYQVSILLHLLVGETQRFKSSLHGREIVVWSYIHAVVRQTKT